MTRAQLALVVGGVAACVLLTVRGGTLLGTLAFLVLTSAIGVYVYLAYRRVRSARKAREKAMILHRVAALETRHATPADVPSHPYQERVSSRFGERGVGAGSPHNS